jgi:hypothetical protein
MPETVWSPVSSQVWPSSEDLKTSYRGSKKFGAACPKLGARLRVVPLWVRNRPVSELIGAYAL